MANHRFRRHEGRRDIVDDAFGGRYIQYTVQNGDTLALIARRFKTTTDTLLALNPILRRNGRVHEDWVLLVPDKR